MIFTKDYEKLSREDKLILKGSYSLSRDGSYTYFNKLLINKEEAIGAVNRFYLLEPRSSVFFGNSENYQVDNQLIETIRVDGNIEYLIEERFFK